MNYTITYFQQNGKKLLMVKLNSQQMLKMEKNMLYGLRVKVQKEKK